MEIKLKVFDEVCRPYRADVGEWYDLAAAETVTVLPDRDTPTMIPLGIAMEVPSGYCAIVAPRSSTPKKHGIRMSNSIGVIDSSYCGPNDQWYFPAEAIKNASTVKKGTRIAQFQLKKCDVIEFIDSDLEHNVDRGGFGTTGIGNKA